MDEVKHGELKIQVTDLERIQLSVDGVVVWEGTLSEWSRALATVTKIAVLKRKGH